MCRSILGLTIVVAMFWSAASRAQSAHKTSSLTELTPRESSSLLLARSEMQVPKPIPIIRPLRFQEIPASLGARRGAEKQSMAVDNLPAGAESQPDSEVAVPIVSQTNGAR